MTTAIATTLFDGRTLSILLATLYAGCSKAAGLLRGRTVTLLHPLNGLQELAACKTLVVLLGKEGLKKEERKNICQIHFERAGYKQAAL